MTKSAASAADFVSGASSLPVLRQLAACVAVLQIVMADARRKSSR